ncbi:hypothetical protein ACJJTC_007146, partial [Scirpophaga incertulas]
CEHGRFIRSLVSSWRLAEVFLLGEQLEAAAALRDLCTQADLARPPAPALRHALHAARSDRSATSARRPPWRARPPPLCGTRCTPPAATGQRPLHAGRPGAPARPRSAARAARRPQRQVSDLCTQAALARPPAPALRHALHAARSDRWWCDVELVGGVGGAAWSLRAHRAVLAARCPALRPALRRYVARGAGGHCRAGRQVPRPAARPQEVRGSWCGGSLPCWPPGAPPCGPPSGGTWLVVRGVTAVLAARCPALRPALRRYVARGAGGHCRAGRQVPRPAARPQEVRGSWCGGLVRGGARGITTVLAARCPALNLSVVPTQSKDDIFPLQRHVPRATGRSLRVHICRRCGLNVAGDLLRPPLALLPG